MSDDQTVHRAIRDPMVVALGAVGFDGAVLVGRGGFGAVYRCRQVELDREVAVKVLTVDLEDNRARFEREQRAMAKLTGHPNIVAVFAIGETPDGHPYLVMPFYRRGCIHTYINKAGALPVPDVLRLGVKIAGALESAHRTAIVHRDVKPANVLLTDYGDPALTDFGIAHMSGGYKTGTGIFTGSPAFTAPEILEGDEPEPASDVYGLGATLYCALTGRAPHERHQGERLTGLLLRIVTEPVPDLRDDGVPDDLAAAVAAAVAADPRQRPSAIELGTILQEVQSANGLDVDVMAIEGDDASGRHALPPVHDNKMHDNNPSGRRSLSRQSPTVRQVPARGNLPAEVAGFVGRDAERAELTELIATSRLVTLAGIGGVGKTTLALQAARACAPNFVDGVWLIELGEVSDGSLLAGVAAAALGVRVQAARSVTDVIVDTLADRAALLILDNCEHVIDTAAELIDTLLRGCPKLRVLATSREVLGIGGEAVLPLSPLLVPDAAGADHDALAGNDAIALFVERARAAQRGFALTGQNAAAVARICAQLDGLPLAIELAAARLRAMSVEQIATRLSDRFGLLTRGKRGAPSRQQTLTVCIAWSYDRCTEAEQRLWSRLSVFAGSFEMGAAHQICAEDMHEDDLLDDLSALVDKSVVIRTDVDGEVRFRQLATLREFGDRQVGSDDERLRLRRRHLGWYLDMIGQAYAEWYGPAQLDWLRWLRREKSNVEEALQFALADEPAAALVMATRLRRLWNTRSLQECRRWLELALDATPAEPTPARLEAAAALAMIVVIQVDFPAVAPRLAEARALLEAVPDARVRGQLLWCDGFAAFLAGDIEGSLECAEQALASTDDFEVQSVVLMQMALRDSILGDPAASVRRMEEGLAASAARGETVMRCYMLGTITMSLFALGDIDRADQADREGVQLCLQTGDIWNGLQFLEGAAWIAAARGQHRRAVQLLAAAAAACRATGVELMMTAMIGGFHDKCVADAREQLSAEDFDAAWRDGDSLPFGEAVTLALRGGPGTRP